MEELKEQLKETTANKDQVTAMKSIIDHPERILLIDDEFSFDNDICMTSCDGRCCIESNIVRVTPIDIDWMMKSPCVKKLNVSRVQLVNDTIDVFPGSISLIPMGVIRCKMMKNMKACPFIGIAHKLFVSKSGIDEKFGGMCSLGQKFKPTICMLYPLGRVTIKHTDTNTEDTWFFTQSCMATEKSSKKIKVRDFIDGYVEKNKESSYYFEEMIKIIDTIKNQVKNDVIVHDVMMTFCAFMFDADAETRIKVDKIKEILPKMLQMAKKAPND